MDYETKVSVSKKLYYGGFFLLPWLWFANFLLFRGDLHKRRAPEELKTCPYLVATSTSICGTNCLFYQTRNGPSFCFLAARSYSSFG
jgi:hypothetical protein